MQTESGPSLGRAGPIDGESFLGYSLSSDHRALIRGSDRRTGWGEWTDVMGCNESRNKKILLNMSHSYKCYHENKNRALEVSPPVNMLIFAAALSLYCDLCCDVFSSPFRCCHRELKAILGAAMGHSKAAGTIRNLRSSPFQSQHRH